MPHDGLPPGHVTIADPHEACADHPTPTQDPQRVGRFEVRRFVGEGAFGRVYEAYDPSLKRVVALKLAKPERLNSDKALERFHREAQATASLLHPNIVAVFDHGDDAGRHYIASAFVAGRPLDEVLLQRQAPLPPREAAMITRRLAEALAYAHRSGVVHRDVKPANVMLNLAPSLLDGTPEERVSERRDYVGEPMLMDFGLAARLDEQDKLTKDGAVLGTYAYMAPEQWRGHAEAASDQYSLGCVLYELLTGRTPFAGSEAEHWMYLHLSQAAPPPRSIQPGVPRDLENIALKCLEKESGSRYPGCQALADDLRRWLDGEAVTARRPGLSERLVKWARRNPAVAGLTAAVFIALATGATVSSAFAYRAKKALGQAESETARAEDALAQAKTEATRAKEVRKFLEDMFTAADPIGIDSVALGGLREGTAPQRTADLISRAMRRLEDKPIADNEVRAEVQGILGNLHRSLGRLPEAERLLKASYDWRSSNLPNDHLDLAVSLHHLGWLRHDQGRYGEAEALYTKALTIRRHHLAPDSPEVLDSEFHLAWLAAQMDDLESAEQQFLSLLSKVASTHGDEHMNTALVRIGLIGVYLERDKDAKALEHIPQALDYVNKQATTNHLERALVKLQQGVLNQRRKKHPEAIRDFEESHRVVLQQLPADHVYAAIILFQKAQSQRAVGELERSEATYRQVLDIARKQVGLGHPKAILLVKDFAKLLLDRKKENEADSLYQELIQTHEAQRPQDGGRFLADARGAYGQYLQKIGKEKEALAQLRVALALYEQTGAERRRLYTLYMNETAIALQEAGQPAEGRRLLEKAMPFIRKQYGNDHSNTAIALTNLAGMRMDLEYAPPVLDQLLEARAIHQSLMGPRILGWAAAEPHPLYVNTLRKLTEYYRRVGQIPKAVEAAESIPRHWPKDPRKLYQAALELARCASAPSAGEACQAYAGKAVALLRRSVDASYRDDLPEGERKEWSRLPGAAGVEELLRKIRGQSAKAP